MEITRISDQRNETLSEFYARHSAEYRDLGDVTNADLLATMVHLLDELNAVDGPSVFGVTSHFRLRLITDDDYRSPTLATINAVIDGPKTFGFDIAYPMPTDAAPWDNAWVHGLAFDVPMALPMIQTALRHSANAS